MQTEILSLSELNLLIRDVIETSFPETCFVIAEIASLRIDQKGHCYLELVERDEETIIAQMRATIWSYNYRLISRQFRSVTGVALSKGIKVLVETAVSFHERYGLSFNIQNIDPSYTLGEMARKRREVIEQLRREGLIERNKELEFPLLPLKIAVISSPHAAGYEDFVNQIQSDPNNYPFEIKLFKAFMQGDNAEVSILGALNRCYEGHEKYDVVVIIRGGGGEADLHCFDSYEIGKKVAMMPIPVISGIGHERDRTVVDEVAQSSVKTPTAAAELLVQRVRAFHVRLVELASRLVGSYKAMMSDSLSNLFRISKDMEKIVIRFLALEQSKIDSHRKSLSFVKKVLQRNESLIDTHKIRCFSKVTQRVKEERNTIEHIKVLLKSYLKAYTNNAHRLLSERYNSVKHLNPRNVLKRGYSITYKNNVLLKDTQNLSQGDIIETVLQKGSIASNVTEVVRDDEETSAII